MPTGAAPIPLPGVKILTGRAWADFLVGGMAQYLLHLVTARLLIRMIPASNPAIGQDWGPLVGLVLVTVAEVLELAVVGLLSYFLVRRVYPVVARGLGYASLVLAAVLLGAFFSCHPLAY